jgi:CopG family nickel-responsive transcriptional regulator
MARTPAKAAAAVTEDAAAKCPGVSRISISMPEELLLSLDAMVANRGFESRSQAVGAMIQDQLLEHQRQLGQQVMVGTITLLYDRSVRGLQSQLAELQASHIDEVISSLHVHLMNKQMLEVLLVQGPAARLQAIADAMTTLRGVLTGRLQLMAAAMPPVHPA